MRNAVVELVGQKVAVIANRYQYRGILSEVTDTRITLANSTAVESSGASSGNAPSVEDPIGGSVHIAMSAVEIVYQPNWVFAPLPGE